MAFELRKGEASHVTTLSLSGWAISHTLILAGGRVCVTRKKEAAGETFKGMK